MKFKNALSVFTAVIFLHLCGTIGVFAEGVVSDGSYRTEELWCKNGSDQIYGIAYVPGGEDPFLPNCVYSEGSILLLKQINPT